MRPNLFVFNRDCPEDFFSRSLAYILNLYPYIGQKLIQRIAVLAGKKSDYFEEFIQCQFTGYEFLDGHSESKPDLMIHCSNRILFFENKLQSPLSNKQMEKHSLLINRIPNSSLIFVSNILHKNTKLKSLQGYLHPENADHYLWIDFIPVFANTYRSNSLAYKILKDFNTALKQNRMISRIINGASESLYTYNSDASHLALGQLWNLLNEIGFKLIKKSSTETTIRVYPIKHRQYPLLNPRFEPTAAWLDEALDKEYINFTVLSRGNNSGLDKKLMKFKSKKDCTYIANPFKSRDGYNYHGHFLLPLLFKNDAIDFDSIKQPLVRMFNFFVE
ncbi:MAG: hypothetical protein PVH88_13860 [Ignavibacteria bacterium]|jgi:hypothetical protein